MTDRMTATAAQQAQEFGLRAIARAASRRHQGVVVGLDEERAAQLGKLAELPSLGEVLAAWRQRITEDGCVDYRVPFRDLSLLANGRLTAGKVGSDEVPPGLAMTYRTFGNILRHYCHPPRNVARCLVELSTTESNERPSPRSLAFNDYLERHNRPERARIAISGERPESTIVRTRLVGYGDVKPERTAIGIVSPSHSLEDGDDAMVIAALSVAFAGEAEQARATAYRGIEESELRCIFPSLDVCIVDSGDGSQGSALWTGYITARNSESGAKSWSVSAGLYRSVDGASVACEAVVRHGRHTGRKVSERMVEAAQGAQKLLRHLAARASELAGAKWPGRDDDLLRQLKSALQGTVASDGDVLCGIAFELGREFASGGSTVGSLMNVLGRLAGGVARRVDARPIEVLLGRVLVDGWSELKAVGSDTNADEVDA